MLGEYAMPGMGTLLGPDTERAEPPANKSLGEEERCAGGGRGGGMQNGPCPGPGSDPDAEALPARGMDMELGVEPVTVLAALPRGLLALLPPALLPREARALALVARPAVTNAAGRKLAGNVLRLDSGAAVSSLRLPCTRLLRSVTVAGSMCCAFSPTCWATGL